jgi:hypothetical protein
MAISRKFLKLLRIPFHHIGVIYGTPGGIRTRTDVGFKPTEYAVLLQGHGADSDVRITLSTSTVGGLRV